MYMKPLKIAIATLALLFAVFVFAMVSNEEDKRELRTACVGRGGVPVTTGDKAIVCFKKSAFQIPVRWKVTQHEL